MASLSQSTTPCAACDKNGVGIFKCEGCTQVFCRKHSIEHRDSLTHQLEEIFVGHDTLQQSIVDYESKQNHYQHLIVQIDTWETDAIKNIHQTAEEARRQVRKLISSQTKIVSTKLNDLAQRLRKAHTDEDYIETDLKIWLNKLTELHYEISNILNSVTVVNDAKNSLVTRLCVYSNNQDVDFEERFQESSGDINIYDNGRIIEHINNKASNAYARCIGEYSQGKHKIRFIIRRKSVFYVMSFDIVSKFSRSTLEQASAHEHFAYGWQTDDSMNNPSSNSEKNQKFNDLRGATILELELLIDCDNHKISYFNEKTKMTRAMDVDIGKCPFPWQLEFYLYDIGDRVEILSARHIL